MSLCIVGGLLGLLEAWVDASAALAALCLGGLGVCGWLVWQQLKEAPKDDAVKPSQPTAPPRAPTPSAPRRRPVADATTPPTVASATPFGAARSAPVGCQWIPLGQRVQVLGYTIAGGVYHGTATAPTLEPAQVNPQLPVSPQSVSWTLDLTSYWPTYAGLTPEARRAYLAWLAAGKHAPDANIGYVFLYFYGLERRILQDAPLDPQAQQEVPHLLLEVLRLLRVYGSQNASFRRYATGLIEFVSAQRPDGEIYLAALPATQQESLPLAFKLTLGRLAQAAQPIPAAWAYLWLRYDPNINLRTPATRCPAAFEKLFLLRYREKFGDGWRIEPRLAWLKVTYHLARPDGHAPREYAFTVADVPDVTRSTATLTVWQKLTEECTQEIEAHSRYLGRNPHRTESLDALLLLPFAAWPETVAQPFNDYCAALCTAQQPNAVILAEWLARWPTLHDTNKNNLTRLFRLAEQCGVGVVPELGPGVKLPTLTDYVVLFPLPDPLADRTAVESSAAPSVSYQTARLTMFLGSSIALADGQWHAAEQQILAHTIAAWPDLTANERARLRAWLLWVQHNPPVAKTYHKHLANLALPERHTLARLLASLVQADGVATAAEVKWLENLAPVLGLEKREVFSLVHQAGEPTGPPHQAQAQPVTVVPPNPAAHKGFAIPTPAPSPIPSVPTKRKRGTPPAPTVPAQPAASAQEPVPPSDEPARPSLNLDLARVRVLQAHDAQLAALLGQIFSEDEPAAPVGASPAPVSATSVTAVPATDVAASAWHWLTLDAKHSALVQRLSKQAEWSRAEVATLAQELGLFLDGALEQINEAAFDAFDEPFTEGEDVLEINLTLLQEESLS